MLKRLFDILFSGTMLLVLAPFLLVLAVLVWMSSPGPVIYRAKRVGRAGKLFTMHKFRTMVFSPSSPGTVITSRSDKRVCAVGAILRRLKLDELPQFYDVLRGAMSVVGPRPEDPTIVDKYYGTIHKVVLSVTPGITSPSSIYDGEECITDTGDTESEYASRLMPILLALDYVYLQRRCFAYDCSLVLRTFGMIVCRTLGIHAGMELPEMQHALEFAPMFTPRLPESEDSSTACMSSTCTDSHAGPGHAS